MAISRIHVSEFTVFSKFNVEFCNGANILIGENGVGKTQLLKMIYASSLAQKRHFGVEEHEVDGKIKMEAAFDAITDIISSVFDVDFGYLREKSTSAKFTMIYDDLICPQVIFIPAKEMLSHAKGLLSMKKKYGINMPFDASLLDIVEKAQAWKLSEMPELAKTILPLLEKAMEGIVEVRDDGSFWMKKHNGDTIPFSMEADGLKRLGLLWQLLMNEGITRDTVVLWDEPEASINPHNIPILVEALLELQQNGVQIIAATHSYNFARYFDVLRKGNSNIQYLSLYKSEEGFTRASQATRFVGLTPNAIDDAGELLFKNAIQKSMEDI